jgi:drug/metabolite transporter (DMT)-like permease
LAAANSSALSILGEGGAAHVVCTGASKLRTLALIMAVMLLNAGGNLLMAWGMKHIPDVSWNPVGYLRAMLNPFVAAGIAVLILWLLTRMALLSWADLSFVLPLTGLGYILNAAAGRLFLNESITATHWAGTLLVFAGTAMVGSTQHHTRLPNEAPQ